MKKLKNILAHRTQGMETSAIREILKVVNQPGMISLAGGIPASEAIPFDEIQEIHQSIIHKYGRELYQYGITEGFKPLREALSQYLKVVKGLKYSARDIIITSGSQNALDAIAMVCINKGDIVAVEEPTYLTAIKTFKAYEADLISIKTDEAGIIPDELEKAIKENKIKLLYTVSTFQNPTGRTISEDRRKKIADILVKYDKLLIEDDPYYELRYRGSKILPIKYYAPDNVVYCGSLSKVFAPGLRIGYYIAPKEISSLMVSVRQAVDLHSTIYGQALAAEFIGSGRVHIHIPKIISIYQPKFHSMIKALNTHLPNNYKYSNPDGGMFIWVEGPKSFDSLEHYQKTIKNNVAFVPGQYFYANGGGKNTMRLNFTTVNENDIDKSIKIIANNL